MTTSEFLDLLKDHKGKSLLFEYRPGELVPANYHITEVKNIQVDSVDCGGGTNAWNETIIQLWESPSEIGKTEYMSSFKALGILSKVDRIKPMDRTAPLKFEYGNAHFHTANLLVDGCNWDDQELRIKLAVTATDCKAKETCGLPTKTVTENQACAPESGCC